MDQYLSDEQLGFREEVRTFLRSNLSASLAARVRSQAHLSREDEAEWQHALYRRGWGAPSWPREFGGAGWTPMLRAIFEDECAAAGAPRVFPTGLSMVGPVIYTFGTPEQKARYLPRIVAHEEVWCQGYSEPGAGSDLSGLRTRAERDGDNYVVNGGKIWTSEAHRADMMFCLVRTDPSAKKQHGISFLLIDMKAPGVAVRPLITIDGGHTLNEVLFENVRVPTANLVGEENMGWAYGKFLLGHERANSADVPGVKRRLSQLKEVARGEQRAGAPLIEDRHFAYKIAGVEIETMALELTNMRLLLSDAEGGNSMQAASMMKLRGSEVQQQIQELTVEALGNVGLPYERQADGSYQAPGAAVHANGRMADYLFRRAATIYSGTSETQRNIIAKTVFGF